ncbi:hypothetical protein EV356DRAFT_504350 [Viridothelium virens]|uniref:tRNA/rRNA methyltransferase SpoU type domain-containing protein n=1 Tax=Viridothelium virens TaxID=1048519 RepID=A0A6A6HLT6_VIRVR|nr:hypothetical protein EV356DRAFT_504350 [Viridothelium virens]
MIFGLLSSATYKNINVFSKSSKQSPIDPTEFSTLIWRRINPDTQDIHAKRTALQLRLRWTALPHPWGPSKKILSQDEYWRSLQEGLRTGFAEQKKTCLYILRLSILMIEHDIDLDHMNFTNTAKAAILTQYERYCAVYETLVITRYINQVEACLHDLDFLASSTCLVHKSWLYALLEAAMGPVMQDSIRNFTGRWFTKTSNWSMQGQADLVHLLEVAYLPWATRGHLYTSSLVVRGQTCICRHGQSIANFINQLLVNSHDNGDGVTSRSMARVLIDFMAMKGRNLFAYAGIYLLLGLIRGLGAAPEPLLDIENDQVILKIVAHDNLAEVAQEFYRAASYSILELLGSPHAGHQLMKSLPSSSEENLSKSGNSMTKWPERLLVWKNLSAKKFSYDDDGFSKLVDPTVENFVVIVHTSQYSCLRRECLSIACDYLEDSLHHVKAPVSPCNLLIALEAIWNEAEIQDYPKHILLRIPRLFLHKTCLTTMTNEQSQPDDLHELIQRVIFELQSMAENRIYVLSPLARALRLSILRDDQFARNFALKEFVVNFANRPPSPKLEFLLELAIVPLFGQLSRSTPQRIRYEDYYGIREGYGYACIYDMLNRVILDTDSARSILDELLDPWINQRRDTPVVSKWKTTVQLQIMFLVMDQAIGSFSANATSRSREYFDKLLGILSIEPLPRYRFLIECIVFQVLAQDGSLRDALFHILQGYDQSNPKYVASLMRLAVAVARLEDSTATYAQDVMTILVTMAASPKVMIRHEAQWSFPFLWNHAATSRLTNITENPAFAALNGYIRNLEQYMTPPPGRKLEPLDPSRGLTMYNIVQGPFLQLYPPEEEHARVTDFELIFADKVEMEGLPPARIPSGELPTDINGTEDDHEWSSQDRFIEQMKPEVVDMEAEISIPIQTKGAARQANALDSISSAENHLVDSHASLVLIASLIKNPHNLGGLSRVAEIFGVGALHIASRTVLTNKEFLAVSMTSEQHLNIQETPLETRKGGTGGITAEVEGLAETLLEMRGNGYKIIGIEQTDGSVVLGGEDAARLLTMSSRKTAAAVVDESKSPERERWGQSMGYDQAKTSKKMALVLGSEKEGIPAWILKECDACIEIPQIGVTRSLNVQTAAAAVLYEYTRLNRIK